VVARAVISAALGFAGFVSASSLLKEKSLVSLNLRGSEWRLIK
jgi:hypothetical protein